MVFFGGRFLFRQLALLRLEAGAEFLYLFFLIFCEVQ